jgi:hypothetical protein
MELMVVIAGMATIVVLVITMEIIMAMVDSPEWLHLTPY